MYMCSFLLRISAFLKRHYTLKGLILVDNVYMGFICSSLVHRNYNNRNYICIFCGPCCDKNEIYTFPRLNALVLLYIHKNVHYFSHNLLWKILFDIHIPCINFFVVFKSNVFTTVFLHHNWAAVYRNQDGTLQIDAKILPIMNYSRFEEYKMKNVC